MKKILCIDGNSILNRQFYGIRFLSTKDGFPTNAIFGFVNVLIRQMEALSPDVVAVAFDLKAPTFRHNMYSEYKAGRKPSPEELIKQFPVAKELCRAMGIAVLELEGYEADDILGTLAAMAKQADEPTEAYILTGDRDSLQLISDRVHVLLATNTDTVDYTDEVFFDKYGVHANQYVDVKALMGDSSDNIPGVAGIGEKTAFKLIAEQGSLDALYENFENIELTKSVRAKLDVGRDSAFMSRTLAKIMCEVPLGIKLENIKFKGIDRTRTRELLMRYELLGAIKRLGLDKDAVSDSPSGETVNVGAAKVKECKTCELDGEWYAFCLNDTGECHLCDGENLYKVSLDDVSRSDLLNRKKIVCYDCKSIYEKLEGLGVHYRDCHFDVMLGAYVDDSSQSSYELERLCSTYLGQTMDEGVSQSVYVASMWRVIEERLEQSGQKELLYGIEMPLAATLCDMELRGVKVDCDGIVGYGHELDAITFALETRIYTEWFPLDSNRF